MFYPEKLKLKIANYTNTMDAHISLFVNILFLWKTHSLTLLKILTILLCITDNLPLNIIWPNCEPANTFENSYHFIVMCITLMS